MSKRPLMTAQCILFGHHPKMSAFRSEAEVVFEA